MRQNNVSWQYYISDYPYLAQLYDRKTQNKIRTQKVHAQRERYRRTARKEEKRKEEKRKEEKSKRAQKQNLEEERGTSRCEKNECERLFGPTCRTCSCCLMRMRVAIRGGKQLVQYKIALSRSPIAAPGYHPELLALSAKDWIVG